MPTAFPEREIPNCHQRIQKTESLDRLRTTKAEKEEFGLQVLKQKYLPVDEIHDLFAVIASGLRQTLDSLQRQFGTQAMNIVKEGIEDVVELPQSNLWRVAVT